LAADGTTVLVSSHVMEEAAHCDELLLLREGKLLATGPVAEILARTRAPNLGEAFVRLIEENA
jgi:ABC-2 type transport system ATP-binding protein